LNGSTFLYSVDALTGLFGNAWVAPLQQEGPAQLGEREAKKSSTVTQPHVDFGAGNTVAANPIDIGSVARVHHVGV
jgi:hypothetical protein